ncbi:MAG: polymerase sigma-70 factor, subfamily [bacterium]|nr:polymerase sigma-70 factor, subfamily [bacterium]
MRRGAANPDLMDPLEHLFRREAGRMVATLTRIFGVGRLPFVEDVVQDALGRALETWQIRGVPDDPAAWLMATAKNRALDRLRHEQTARAYESQLARHIDSEQALREQIDEIDVAAAMDDDQLRMMFSCCDPRLTEESQVGLVLHILCGFSVPEIANAFLSRHEAVKKRITRAKALLAGSKKLFDLTDADFNERLSSVQRAVYLLFNEGFHGSSKDAVVRAELCDEAMRLAILLTRNTATATPATFALCSLMFLNAARLPARLEPSGDLMQLLDQDRSRWDERLLSEGHRLLEASATGSELTAYHLEAAIASLHMSARDPHDTPWREIVSLYDVLMRVRPSPVVALSRALAIAQCDGPARGLEELRANSDSERLAAYPFYAAELWELELDLGRRSVAREHYRAALALARNLAERRFLERRIAACESDAPEK